MMFKKNLIILILFCGALTILAVENKKNNEPALEPLDQQMVISALDSINQQFNTPNSIKTTFSQVYICFSISITDWLKQYPFIEADTGIEKSWFERAAKMLDYMGECKSLLERLKNSHREHNEEYLKTEANLKEVAKRFDELVKNPTLVEHNKLERLRAEKAKWEAQHHREKEKKAGIASPE